MRDYTIHTRDGEYVGIFFKIFIKPRDLFFKPLVPHFPKRHQDLPA
jgi:hypothetical protein